MGTTPRMYHGDDARKFFFACFNSFTQDDATGKAYVVRRNAQRQLEMLPLTGCALEGVAIDLHNNEGNLSDCEMIVIDSGNSHGDSWIATYYPQQGALTFIDGHFAGAKSSCTRANAKAEPVRPQTQTASA